MRKLASIQKIEKLEPIPEKDKIELATVLGWQVIVQKGQFQPGDLCIYCEVDSILPEKPEFEFLRSRCYSKKWKGFRIRSMKMAGLYSQGIVFPLHILPEKYISKLGEDVTDILNIKKYDPEAVAEQKQLQNNKKWRKVKNPIFKYFLKYKWIRNIFFPLKPKGKFPSEYVSKTDETRIQVIPNIIKEFERTECFITEKLDGCSASYIYSHGKFIVASRNIINKNEKSHYWKIAKQLNIKNKLKPFKNIAIQGEIIGEGVGNGSGINLYKIKGLDFYIFNVIDTKTKRRYSLREMKKFAKQTNLKLVPIINEDYTLGTHNVQELLELSKGKSKIADVLREGIVIRDVENKYKPIQNVGDFLSFKVINPDFDLKYLK